MLHLSFKTNEEKYNDFIHTKPIKINKIQKLKWNITNEILNKCKLLPIGHEFYCEPYNNNNWCFIFLFDYCHCHIILVVLIQN